MGLSRCSHSAKPVSDESYLLLSYFLIIRGSHAETCVPLMHLLRLPGQERLSGNLSHVFLYMEMVSVQTSCCVPGEKLRKHKSY